MIYDDTQDVDDLLETDTDALVVNGFDVRNVAFIMPLGAPLPSEFEKGLMPTGSLYQRIRALDTESWVDGDEFAFVPVSGAELLALERAWRALVRTKKVVMLSDIPAARYDVLFTQAARQIGIQTVDWPSVSDALSERFRTRQRIKDGQPWTQEIPTETPPAAAPKGRRLPRAADDEDELIQNPAPAEDE